MSAATGKRPVLPLFKRLTLFDRDLESYSLSNSKLLQKFFRTSPGLLQNSSTFLAVRFVQSDAQSLILPSLLVGNFSYCKPGEREHSAILIGCPSWSNTVSVLLKTLESSIDSKLSKLSKL